MKFTLGVCAMETKVESSPMKSILKHLKDSGDFEIIIFPERMILYAPVTDWPVVECLIAFYSLKFPLEKAIEYVKLVKPIILNDLEKQRIMRSRINIYRELQACRIPHPNYLLVDHDLVKKGVHTFEEHYDYIVYNNVRLNKPFIEKPLDSDDHNNWIYYPSNTGGGCKKLFRKIHDRSSEYCPDIHSVRKNGTYIYEEFMLTYGTDIKVYAVGSMFAHAEARKSPTLDGKVNRYSDGKEYRYPIILTTEEKTIAYRIVDHFGQTVCGFDILRTFDGPYVCDVNGWSFVKRNKKYHIDCCQIIRAIFLLKLQAKYNILIDSVLQNKPQGYQVVKTEFGDRLIDSRAVSGAAARARRLTAIGSKFDNSLAGVASKDATIGIEMDTDQQGLVESDPENSLESKLGDKSDNQAHRDSSNKSNEELCSVIVVMRHADRKPKHKLKFFTRRQEILDYFTGNESEVKLKSSEELITMCQVNDQIIADLEEKIAFINATSSSLDAAAVVGDGPNRANIGGMGTNLMSNSHSDPFNRAATGCIAAINRANSSVSGLNQLLLEFNYHKEFQRILKKGYEFLGINRKVQLKAVYAPRSGSPNPDDGSASCTSGDESSGKEASFRKIEKVLVIAKWGGDLTDVGKCQAEDLGRKLRQTLYPADSGALIRLHSTYRHDFKIFSSDEGRCQITGAAFTKGILDLEGELTPILVAMTIRNKKAYQLLNETFIVEERTKCRYKLDELITHFGTPEYEEILQEMPEYDRYYYNKALEDAEFSQEDLVNLSKLIRYYIATLNKEEMMWSSLYSVDDYAFHIVNKLSGMQNRWGQLLLKFHKPPCVGYGRINSDLLSRLNAGSLGGLNGPYRKLDSNLLDRIYGQSGRSVLDVMCSSKPGWKATSEDNSRRSVCTYSNANSTPGANHVDADTEINGAKNGTSGSPFRDDEVHSSDYCPEERYDYTKLSDIVDNIRYDLIHMHQLLGPALETAFEIYRIVERLSSVISPCEYGVTPIEKLQIGAKIAWNLLKKIQHDVSHQRVRMTPHTYQDNLLTGPTSSVNTASLAGSSVGNSSINSVVPTMHNTQRDSSSSLNESGLAPENVLNPESLNSNNILDTLDYDIDFMVNNDTSAASIAANSLAMQGTYLDSSKIFENGRCFIGGIKPTEMYQFNSNTRTECLWTTLSGKSTCISSNSSDTSTVNPIAAQASPASSKNSAHSSKHKSARLKHGSRNGSRSARLSSVGSKDSGDGNNDDSLLLNSYSLWLHMSPSENQQSDEFSNDVSNLINTGHPMASSLNSTSIAGRGSSNTGSTNSSSSANDTDPNKLNTPPKKHIVNSHLNRLDPNQGWGWDEKIFDDLIRLDTNEDLGIRSQQRVVRSRYYVTSASHLFSVLNFFKYAHLLDDSFDTNLKHIENINDLHYLSHIVIRVWRSRGSEGFFNRLEILVSSGAKDGFGQNLGILEQSARNQKNKYKRHIQRYKLHAMQEPNCPRCPIFLNGVYGTADNQLGVSINSDGYGHSNFHNASGMVSTYSSIGSTFDDIPIRIAPTSKDDGATAHLSIDGGFSAKNMGQNAHSPRSLNSPLSSSGSDIVGRYNLMVGDLSDGKYKCFKCFIEQYRSSDVQNIAPSPKIGQRELHHHAGSSPANVALSTAESVNDFGSVAATAGSAIDTAGSCTSGMDNRAEGSASNKTVPPYCELNSLVVMNRNFGLDRLNNLIEKTYEQIISKG